MRIFVCMAVMLLVVSAASAGDEIKGKVSGINVKKNILDVSGVRINASKAVTKGLDGKSFSLLELKLGDSVEVAGAFSGRGKMLANEIEKESVVEF
jgi:hypothetical protein